MVFPVIMYGYERCTIKKAECQRIDAFELWCWRTLKNPLDSKEIQPVHPKENRGGCGKEGGGFRMGGTGVPVADSFRCLAELIQYCKV